MPVWSSGSSFSDDVDLKLVRVRRRAANRLRSGPRLTSVRIEPFLDDLLDVPDTVAECLDRRALRNADCGDDPGNISHMA
ncbi:MAG TPA: hypothetical protein VHJ83_14055 [Micromonosporaceae bacterium]|nr:hypothetical protein [Micromonosporaceae bacterium]